MKWKKYLALSISVIALLFSGQIIHACADFFNDYEDNTHFFGNEAPDKPVYFPFNFTPYDAVYGGYYTTRDTVNSLNKAFILKEWQSYLKHGISIKDIGMLLYKGDTNTFVRIKLNKNLAAENLFVQYLQKKSHLKVLNYLIYAKKCEVNAQRNADVWPSEKEEPTVSNETLEQEGLQAIRQIKDAFLRMKYAFQIMRMAFYAKRYDTVLHLFNQLLRGKQDKSIAYTRILGLRAGAYYHLGNKVKAGYYYTKMFDNNDAYKFDAMISFNWAIDYRDDNNFDAIYALCQSDHEKAVALVMKALHTLPLDLQDIRKAYTLDPNVDAIAVLINREINKLERKYFAKKIRAQNELNYPEHQYAWSYYRPVSQKEIDSLDSAYAPYIESLNTFTNQLIADNKTGDRSLWYLVKSYLACMQNKPVAIAKNLKQAEQSGMNSYESALHNMISLLHIIYRFPKITPETEKKMLSGLKRLNELAKKNRQAQYQFQHFMNYLVAGKYFQQGDTTKGIYAMAHSTVYWRKKTTRNKFYASPAFEDKQGEVLNLMSVPDLKKVIAFSESPSKSPFEKWLVGHTYYTPGVLKELLGTKYIRHRNFKAAVNILNKNNMNKEYYPNPFMPHINDIHRIIHRDTLRKYTKLSFSKRMAELQQIIAQNPDDAGALYGYAVALFNISYYGKSDDITEYSRHSTDRNAYFKWTSDKKLPEYLKEYYRVYDAEKYFLKTAEAANNPELKAKALWGAAKCWEKRSPMNYGVKDYYKYYSPDYDSAYYHHALQNPYFQKLQVNYMNTRFMKKVRNTCDYFSDYVRQYD